MIKTQSHLSYTTKMTRDGVRDMTNRKPFRTKAQKKHAQESAFKRSDGAWQSNAPVSFHR